MMMMMSRKLRVHLWCFVHLSYLLYTLTDACPGRLTCALLRREPCPAGSRACGPCRALHTLGAQGHCVSDDRRHRLGLPGDDADEEEEFIASVLSGAHTTTTATSGGDGDGGGHGGGDGDGGGGASEPRAGEQRRGGKAHGQQWQHLRGASSPGASPPGASPPGAAVSATVWRGQEEQQEEEEETRRGKSRGREGDDTKEDPGRAGDTRESRRHRAGRRGKGAHGEAAMSGGGGGGGGGHDSTPRAHTVWRIDAQQISTRHEIGGEIEEEEEVVDVKTLQQQQQTRGRGTGGGGGGGGNGGGHAKKPVTMTTISGGGGGDGGAGGAGGGDGTSGQNSEPGGGGGSDVGVDIASTTTKDHEDEEVVVVAAAVATVGGDRSDDLEPEISKPLGTVAGRLAASKSASAPSPLLLVAAMVSTVAAVSALITMAACWYRLHRAGGMVQKADYRVCSAHSPGSQRPPTLPRADSRLAHRAQLYHYQQKRQQLMAMDRETEESQTPNSLTDSENEEGDITVYECPGLAPTGEMEVNNPLFDEMRANSPSHTPGR
ncbi:neural proliferation differentiation and control protein 1 [Lethenteron reissneri]|uniref:neural proliferation differentiation and control protein 1 n=1 Tax=Lethenteron reissneri TaxID=7753 RepID=UPI002AB79555|nr:neural proliferation differentiation and control protein 1 [Lethenteron reissneri]